MNSDNSVPERWYEESAGFFGVNYMRGDDSVEGYLDTPMSLGERTKREVTGILYLTGLNSGDSLIDVPCGYGRHAIALAEQGILVTGIDINNTHLEKARENTPKKSKNIRFVLADMLDGRYFSENKENAKAVINMFYSFGFFPTDEENMQVLKNFFTLLRRGGKFLMHTDVNVPRILAGKYKTHELRRLPGGKELAVTDYYNAKTKRIIGSWQIDDWKRDYSVRVYERQEFEDMCREVGFCEVETFSSWEGEKYSEDAEEMMVVATK